MRDPVTGKEYPPTLPPNGSVVANVSVVNKLVGDPTIDIVSFAVLRLQVWFPKEPTKPVIGDVPMSNKNGSLNRNEWVGEIGGGGAGGKVWPLPECTRVYWYIRIWDLANREINSSNSLAAAPVQNFTVGGGTQKCLFAPGARFQDYFDVEQSPLNATHLEPGYPSESKPGPGLQAGKSVRVHLIPRKWIQLPWVMLSVNQTNRDGDFNSSWLIGVRGYCRDFSVSPNVCDVSGEKDNPDLPLRNGTEFVFDLPGLYPGTFIQYGIVAVDHALPDYQKDPGFITDPWSYTGQRRFCDARPRSCLASPEFYYRIPDDPPVDLEFIGRLSAQLLREVTSPSGKKVGVDYVDDGCVQFGNDTWRSQILRVNEFGFAQSEVIVVHVKSPGLRPVEF
ncbi:MAG TPA: hypothetical protein VI893_02965, partial [Thermoplasmata archaeon]|nr:hypothetical protein [Thermoplasmata archaeon]